MKLGELFRLFFARRSQETAQRSWYVRTWGLNPNGLPAQGAFDSRVVRAAEPQEAAALAVLSTGYLGPSDYHFPIYVRIAVERWPEPECES